MYGFLGLPGAEGFGETLTGGVARRCNGCLFVFRGGLGFELSDPRTGGDFLRFDDREAACGRVEDGDVVLQVGVDGACGTRLDGGKVDRVVVRGVEEELRVLRIGLAGVGRKLEGRG